MPTANSAENSRYVPKERNALASRAPPAYAPGSTLSCFKTDPENVSFKESGFQNIVQKLLLTV